MLGGPLIKFFSMDRAGVSCRDIFLCMYVHQHARKWMHGELLHVYWVRQSKWCVTARTTLGNTDRRIKIKQKRTNGLLSEGICGTRISSCMLLKSRLVASIKSIWKRRRGVDLTTVRPPTAQSMHRPDRSKWCSQWAQRSSSYTVGPTK